MTRKDYIAIAASIRAQRGMLRYSSATQMLNMRLDALAEDLSKYFAEDTPLFDRMKFLKAAGAIS